MSKPYDPVAQGARNKLWNAIWYRGFKRGKTCETCGTTGSPIRGHIADYSKPLDVQWMCASCHNRFHFAIKRSAQQQERAA